MNRQDVLARLRRTVAEGRPIIGAGAGTGLSAKCAEAGGVDLIIIYNSGRYRMAGPRLARRAAAVRRRQPDRRRDGRRRCCRSSSDTPVLAGVCGTDPFRLMPAFLDQLAAMGFAGVQNFPTVGLYDGVFRQNLEETGMGYDLEVEMVRLAHERDLVTAPYVFDAGPGAGHGRGGRRRPGPARRADHQGQHRRGHRPDPGRGRRAGAGDARRRGGGTARHPRPLPRRPDRRARGRRATSWRAPRASPGFFGASSVERLPTERAITEQVRAFKTMQN